MNILNTRMTTPTAVAAGGEIPVGYTVHKSGCALSAGASTWWIRSGGYYKITASATFDATAAGDVEIDLNAAGAQIASATATAAAAGDTVNASLVGVVYSRCGCTDTPVTITAGAAGTAQELDVVIERI